MSITTKPDLHQILHPTLLTKVHELQYPWPKGSTLNFSHVGYHLHTGEYDHDDEWKAACLESAIRPILTMVLTTSPPTFYGSCHRPNPQTSPSFAPALSCFSTKHLRTSSKVRRGCRPSGTSNRSPCTFIDSASPSPPIYARGVWSAGSGMGGALNMRWRGSSSSIRRSCTPPILMTRRCSTASSRTTAWRLRRSSGLSFAEL